MDRPDLRPEDSSHFADAGETSWGGDPTVGQNTFMQTLQAQRDKEFSKQAANGRAMGRLERWHKM
ncbi:MAG: hypothetical protein RLZZ271_202, partial [Pseudomonadota bacterium]